MFKLETERQAAEAEVIRKKAEALQTVVRVLKELQDMGVPIEAAVQKLLPSLNV